MPHAATPLVVGLGESLFDCFPDGREAIGGAPLNVAVHAQQLLAGVGGGAALATRVGADARGDRLLDEAGARGLDVSAVQRDPQRPTGRVLVSVDPHGDPSYDIAGDAAWDRLVWTDALGALAARASAVAFGTLARRGPTADATIGRFLAAASSAVRLFDVNLRQAHWTPAVIVAGLRSATVLKVSEGEVGVVWSAAREAGHVGDASAGDADTRCIRLREAFALQLVVLTRGARGTVLYAAAEGRLEEPPTRLDSAPGADSVGAGDACSAAVLAGLLTGQPLCTTLRWANAVGAYVAASAGATPRLPSELRAPAR
jgi:fructokinase